MILPPVAAGAVLFGAALHAAWNVGVRYGARQRETTAVLAASTSLIGAAALPLLPAPAAAAWPHLAISAVLHVVYFNLVAEAYALGAISLTYPVMRGTAPAMAAAMAAVGFGERLRPLGWGGLVLISAGVVLQTRRDGAAGEGRALAIALTNALVIALYTVNDGIGARISHSPIAYALWTFVLPGVPAALILTRGRVGRVFAEKNAGAILARGAGGGACSVASYTLALWAMTLAPIGAVAALRESAMVFGVAFAWMFLHERPHARTILAALTILLGAVVLDMG